MGNTVEAYGELIVERCRDGGESLQSPSSWQVMTLLSLRPDIKYPCLHVYTAVDPA